jgi:hypothetical protein
VASGHAVDHIGEVGFRIEAIELGALQDGVEDGGALAARLGAEEQEVLAGDGDGAQGPFGGIVVDRQPAVAGVAQQRLPAGERVLDGTSQRVLRRQSAALDTEPVAQRIEQRHGASLPRGQPSLRWLAGDLGLDRIKLADPSQRLLGDRRGGGFEYVVELAPGMGPARRMDHGRRTPTAPCGRARQSLVAAEGVFQQQFELFDLMIELLRRAAELHPPQHRKLRPILLNLQPGAGQLGPYHLQLGLALG